MSIAIQTSRDQMTDISVAALRVAIGSMVVWLHGWHKVVDGWKYFTADTDWPLLHDTMQLGLPAPVIFTVAATMSQFLGAALLAAGLLTRLTALSVAATMLTAWAFNLQTSGPDAQLAALYALTVGVFIGTGGGWWSFDRWFRDRGRPSLFVTKTK